MQADVDFGTVRALSPCCAKDVCSPKIISEVMVVLRQSSPDTTGSVEDRTETESPYEGIVAHAFVVESRGQYFSAVPSISYIGIAPVFSIILWTRYWPLALTPWLKPSLIPSALS